VTCTKTGPKNDPFFNCRRKTKELSKKELSNVAPASEKSSRQKFKFEGWKFSKTNKKISAYTIKNITGRAIWRQIKMSGNKWK